MFMYICISRARQYPHERELSKSVQRPIVDESTRSTKFPRSSSVSQAIITLPVVSLSRHDDFRRTRKTIEIRGPSSPASRSLSSFEGLKCPCRVYVPSNCLPGRVRAGGRGPRDTAVPRTVAVLLGGSLVGRWVALSKSRAEQQSPR